jgi:hypothetical protein
LLLTVRCRPPMLGLPQLHLHSAWPLAVYSGWK